MTQQESNENNTNVQSLESSPISYESGSVETRERILHYPFAKPIKTCTNLPLKKRKKKDFPSISLFIPNVTYPVTNLFNSGNKATEMDYSQKERNLKIKIPQPEQPTLILKEYSIYQNFLKATGNVHQNQLLTMEEHEPIIRSKSGEFPVRPIEISQKKKHGPKRKYMEPVRLHSSRRAFPERPYVPYDEIIGYVDDYPYDHFGSREDRKDIENENPNNKIIELMNKIQAIAHEKYTKEEKEISQKFATVEKNPIDILLINQKKFINNDKSIEKEEKIKINRNLYRTFILPAPIIKNPPYHIFLQRILKNDQKMSNQIAQSSSKLMLIWNRLKAFKMSDISKYTTFAQVAADIWPRLYKETKADRNSQKVDIKNMITKYHQSFLLMEEIELKYYSELLGISFSPDFLVVFNYDPNSLFN